jgi:hypothetical protein
MRGILIVFLAALSLGFYVESPDATRQRKREEKTWRRDIGRAYDMEALHRFFETQLQALAEVDGVAFSKSSVDRKWKFEGTSLVCGSWSFRADVKTAEFSISWVYDEAKRDDGSSLIRSVVLRCRRTSRKTFELIRASREEDEIIILSV